mgnify:CR=1 FL=1
MTIEEGQNMKKILKEDKDKNYYFVQNFLHYDTKSNHFIELLNINSQIRNTKMFIYDIFDRVVYG